MYLSYYSKSLPDEWQTMVFLTYSYIRNRNIDLHNGQNLSNNKTEDVPTVPKNMEQVHTRCHDLKNNHKHLYYHNELRRNHYIVLLIKLYIL